MDIVFLVNGYIVVVVVVVVAVVVSNFGVVLYSGVGQVVAL